MKLSEEQASAIMQAMSKKRDESYWNALIGPNEFQFMQKIIDDCTEKKFPSIEMVSGWEYREQKEIVTVRLVNLSDNRDYIEIESDERASVSFTNSKFIEFVAKCQKIVEWIKEQECKEL